MSQLRAAYWYNFPFKKEDISKVKLLLFRSLYLSYSFVVHLSAVYSATTLIAAQKQKPSFYQYFLYNISMSSGKAVGVLYHFSLQWLYFDVTLEKKF